MPNAVKHAKIGAVAGGAAALVVARRWERKLDAGEIGVCTGLGMLAAGIPDLLEPAVSPRHRQTAHSILVLAVILLLVGWYCTRDTEQEKEFTKMMAAAAGAGYLSHLLADAFTPAGLPWA